MVEKDIVFTAKIKQKGIFDYPSFYRFCYEWLIEKGYFLIEKGYTEKIGAGGKEVEIEWDATRKISDYFKFQLKVTWHIIGMTDIEVQEDGKKIKMNKGYPEIKVQAVLLKDYEHRWEGNPFFKFLRGLYDRYIIRARIESYEAKIHQEGDEFLAQAKAFLALEGKH